MSDDTLLEQAEPGGIAERSQAISVYQLIAATLVTGDILLGGIFKHWKWNDRTLSIAFNTSAGQRFGSSLTIDIPINLVADIFPVPLDDSSVPQLRRDDEQVQFVRRILDTDAANELRLLPQDYPNPLATILCDHNLAVASRTDLKVGEYIEYALPQSGIPPEGISFKDDFVLYADWEFFRLQTGGPVSVSGGIPAIVEIQKELSRSPQQQVLQRLREGPLLNPVRQKLSPTAGECLLDGCVRIGKSPMSTTIEGAECQLWTVIASDDTAHPVLVKLQMLKYPLELISRVTSSLKFYGELLPIPITLLDTDHELTLLARAIGYLHTG